MNTPDTESTFKPFEGKVPQTANIPNEETSNQWQARAQNIETNNLLNAGVVSGVNISIAPQEARAVDPLLLAKIIQQKASFANNYTVDSVETTITAPVKHIIKLVSSARNLDAKHIVINTTNYTISS